MARESPKPRDQTLQPLHPLASMHCHEHQPTASHFVQNAETNCLGALQLVLEPTVNAL